MYGSGVEKLAKLNGLELVEQSYFTTEKSLRRYRQLQELHVEYLL